MESELELPVTGVIDLGIPVLESESALAIPIINERQIKSVLANLPSFQNQGIVNIFLLGNGGKAFPPLSLRHSIEFSRMPDRQRVGIMRWKKGRNLIIRVEPLAAIFQTTQPTMNLASLSKALREKGWVTRDIEYSQGPVTHVDDGDQEQTEVTAIITVVRPDDLDKAVALLSEAIRHLGRKDWPDAVRCFSRALDFHPWLADAWAGKAGAMMSMGAWSDAIAYCDNALTVQRDHAGAWFNKGLCHVNWKKDIPAALECFRQAARLGMKEAAAALQQLQRVRV